MASKLMHCEQVDKADVENLYINFFAMQWPCMATSTFSTSTFLPCSLPTGVFFKAMTMMTLMVVMVDLCTVWCVDHRRMRLHGEKLMYVSMSTNVGSAYVSTSACELSWRTSSRREL